MSKKKDLRSKKHDGRYKAQVFKTARNKARRLERFNKRKAKWVALGKKKNGQPVKK